MTVLNTLLNASIAVLTIGAATPYVIETARGRTKPRVVTWFTWGLVDGIGFAAAFADGQYAAFILLLCSSLMCGLTVAVGFKHGDRRFTVIDVACQIGAFIGIAIWLITESPAGAVIVLVVVNLVGSIPTLIHSWVSPYEETLITYALFGFSSGIAVLSAGSWMITGVAIPLYALILNAAIVTILVLRRGGSKSRRVPVGLTPQE